MASFMTKIGDFLNSTAIPEQVKEVDYVGLFTNPWFLVPFVAMIAYFLYKQAFKDIILVLIFIAIWWVSGTDYMAHLTDREGKLILSKVLPVVGGGTAVLALVIYMFFVRSD